MSLRAGEWVEVLGRDEILATLDANGRLDGLPFMPEMFEHCGKRFEVWKRAHKTCDTVNGTGGLRLTRAVHLKALRCNGRAHGGCGAQCSIFWKDAWLRRVDGPPFVRGPAAFRGELQAKPRARGCSEADVRRATRVPGDADAADPTYSCQATLLPGATTRLRWWDVRQYVEDYTSGNVPAYELFAGAIYMGYNKLVNRVGRVAPRVSAVLMDVYDAFQSRVGGVQYPRRQGTIPTGQRTPSRRLGLEPGELVQIRSYREILATLDGNNKNRGMFFDAEEVPYCGKTMRVVAKVDRIIDEKTGKMIMLKDHNVILDGAACQGHYSNDRMHCPRAIYALWRETWLQRPAPIAKPAAPPVERAPSRLTAR
jgi:hypothetical protein